MVIRHAKVTFVPSLSDQLPRFLTVCRAVLEMRVMNEEARMVAFLPESWKWKMAVFEEVTTIGGNHFFTSMSMGGRLIHETSAVVTSRFGT